MGIKEEIIPIFPESISYKLLDYIDKNTQEIRIKVNKPIIIYKNIGEIILGINISSDDIKYILKRISNYSLYAYEEEIRQGFITLKGGHRIGLAGECVMEKNRIKTIKNISSINIRITKEIIGAGNKVLKGIVENGNVKNTLIVAPPKCGKTTVLRDLTRLISSGNRECKIDGKKVVVIDERSEIGASYLGIPQMDLGIRTDVLDNCLKREGMLIAIRSLSPDVLICDEIGTKEDIDALVTAFNSGVNVVVTVHGSNLKEILDRGEFNYIIKNQIIQRVVLLNNKNGVGTLDKIYEVSKGGEFRCLDI